MPDAWYWGDSKRPPGHTCGGHKDTRNDPGIGLVLEPYVTSKPARSYANGTLTLRPRLLQRRGAQVVCRGGKREGTPARSLVPAESGKPGVVVVDLASPYLLTKAGGEAAGADAVEVSIDGGKTFRAVDLKDFTDAVRGQVAAQVKITFKQSLQGAEARSHRAEQFRRPALSFAGQERGDGFRGRSQGAGRQPAGGHLRLRLGQPQQVVRADVRRRQGDRQGARRHVGRYGHLRTEDVPAGDLPAKFEIDCPTPKGRYPVYPRMLLVRREMLGAGAVAGAAARAGNDARRRGKRGSGDAAQPMADRHATAARWAQVSGKDCCGNNCRLRSAKTQSANSGNRDHIR